MEVRRQGSQFFPSTSWVLGVELSTSYLAVMPLLTEPSLWPLIFIVFCVHGGGVHVYMCVVHIQVHTCEPEHVCMCLYLVLVCMLVCVPRGHSSG